jgi:hypothetical protein
MKLSKDLLKNLISASLNAHPDEIGCDDCYEQLHEFAELKLEGKSAEEAMPLVEDHLKRCGECEEEFEVLLEALKAEQSSS